MLVGLRCGVAGARVVAEALPVRIPVHRMALPVNIIIIIYPGILLETAPHRRILCYHKHVYPLLFHAYTLGRGVLELGVGGRGDPGKIGDREVGAPALLVDRHLIVQAVLLHVPEDAGKQPKA